MEKLPTKIQVKVSKVDDTRHKYVVEYNGKNGFFVPQLKFQIAEEKPATLDCIVTYTNEGKAFLAQDLEKLMVSKGYKVGSEVTYTIKHQTALYYELEDQYGFRAILPRNYNINTEIYPKIRCRITKLSGQRPKVELIQALASEEKNFSIKSKDVKKILGNQIWNADALIQLLLSDIRFEMFDVECHNWIINTAKSKPEDQDLLPYIKDIKDTLQSVLEESDLLELCNNDERPIIDKRLTLLIEQTNYFLQALKYMEVGEEKAYIDSLFTKLSKSGAIYHSKDQFYIMTCIFLQNNELLHKYIPTIFSTMLCKEIERWKQNPYRRAWIKLLELYIKDLYAKTEEIASNKNLAISLMQALALQLSLYESADERLIDATLNSSILYRMASRMNVGSPEAILDAAFKTIVEELQELPTSSSHAKLSNQPDFLANYLSNELNSFNENVAPTKKFEGEHTSLSIANGKISFYPKDKSIKDCCPALPDSLGLRHGIQIYTPERLFVKAKADDNITKFKNLWNDIELDLKPKAQKISVAKSPVKKELKVDDVVNIVIRKQTNDFEFECEIVENEIKGNGTINVFPDILRAAYYKPSAVSIKDFIDKDGKPLIYEALIKEKKSNGRYVFNMEPIITEDIIMYKGDNALYSDTYTALVTFKPASFNRIVAITKEGYPVSVGFLDRNDFNLVEMGKYIRIFGMKSGRNGFLQADFRESDDTDISFSVNDAFHILIQNSALSSYEEEKEEKSEPNEVEDEDILENKYVEEIMYIIDRYASVEKDYIKIYNYYGICRLMASILKLDEKAMYYKNRMSLIELLQDFSVNGKIDEEKIKKMESLYSDLFQKNSNLQYSFKILQLISYMSKEEYNEELYSIANDNSLGKLQILASLVLSYNFVTKQGLSQAAEEIHNKVRRLIHLAPKESKKKFYGDEDAHTEFKTSLVYPESSMKLDKDAQTHKILEEICAFLNAEGGTLYLGVNNYGYEAGLEEDLKQFENNRDKYKVYLDNQIVRKLGLEAGHCISSSFDADVESSVLILNINPSRNPIKLDGEYYERMGTSCRCVDDEYKETFLLNKQERMAQSASVLLSELEHSTEEEFVSGEDFIISSDIDTIMTSHIRNNARHDYEDNFVPDINKSICFKNSTDYFIDNKEVWKEFPLCLGIHESEENAFLIVVYEDGCVCRVKMSDILGHTVSRIHKMRNESKPAFICPASIDDALISFIKDSKDNIHVRIDDIEKLQEGSMMDSGNTLHDLQSGIIVQNEIVKIKAVEGFIKRNAHRKTFGMSITAQEARSLIEYLEKHGVQTNFIEK